jgi:hypothetical protein
MLLASCGGGGDAESPSTPTQGNPPPSTTPIVTDTTLKAGYYPAGTGSGGAVFYDLTMAKDGFLDLTTFKSSVSLLGPDLSPIDSDLTSDDLIRAGVYKVKITYQPTSNLPGNLTVFSFDLMPFASLPVAKPGSYQAVKSLGTYSEYYRIDLSKGGFVDVSTTKGAVYALNYTKLGSTVASLTPNLIRIDGNKYLEPGDYMVKFTYESTSLTPGTVSLNYIAN